jgi:hypothetical protein
MTLLELETPRPAAHPYPLALAVNDNPPGRGAR